MNLFLVRHGETNANKDGIVQGWLETDLNEQGRVQVQDAAELFNEQVDVIYSSDLKRTKQTANVFRQKYPHIPYFEDERLRERCFGDAEGAHRDNHDWEVFWASRDVVSIPNAETLDEFSRRIQSFIDMLKESGFSDALVVTHGGTINRFQDLTSINHQRVKHGNASVTHIKI